MLHKTGDPSLKPRLFSKPKIFLQQFRFHEIRLTDEMYIQIGTSNYNLCYLLLCSIYVVCAQKNLPFDHPKRMLNLTGKEIMENFILIAFVYFDLYLYPT